MQMVQMNEIIAWGQRSASDPYHMVMFMYIVHIS